MNNLYGTGGNYMSAGAGFALGLGLLYVLLIFISIAFFVLLFVLCIKALKALNIYIRKNQF